VRKNVFEDLVCQYRRENKIDPQTKGEPSKEKICVMLLWFSPEPSQRCIFIKKGERVHGSGPLACKLTRLLVDRGVNFESVVAAKDKLEGKYGKQPRFFSKGNEIACCFEKGQPRVIGEVSIGVQSHQAYTPWRCEFVSAIPFFLLIIRINTCISNFASISQYTGSSATCSPMQFMQVKAMQSTAGKCQNERATFEKFIGLFVPEHLVKAIHLRLLQMYHVPDQRHN
jgi:hypothetical protein